MTEGRHMTTPTPTTNVPALLRAIISIVETVAFVLGLILAALNNGSDLKSAILAGFVGFIAHGVNHNAGGSPI